MIQSSSISIPADFYLLLLYTGFMNIVFVFITDLILFTIHVFSLLDPPNGSVIKYHSSITFWKIPFPHWIPWHLCQKSIPTYDQSNSVPLIYSFIFMQMSHCIYYCCIIVNYKFWSINLWTVFLNKTLTCRSFVSPDIFRINFSIFI